MYGGYGNIWNQGAPQWPAGNVQNPNQFPVQNQNQQSMNQGFPGQQGMMGYGGNMGNVGNQNPAGAGMMNYMNMGMGANPFMNYGGLGAGAGYGMQATPTTTPGWMGTQQFQLRPTFPNGRPPLPPGPPPPDPPQQAAPPPPPPPPASQPEPQKNELSLNQGKLISTGSTVPGTSMNLEDAFNIIKSAAPYSILPSSNPLAPVPATLNVSEELFGSKKDDKGIPGLDMVQEEKPPTPPGPEVVDLEIDPSRSFLSGKQEPNNQNGGGQQAPSEKKEVVWELRPELKTEKGSELDKANGDKDVKSGWSSWKTNSLKTESDEKVLRDSDGPSGTETKKPEEQQQTSIKSNNSENSNGVKIKLEPTNGKEIVYDRKTLKQFDTKFREWENQFEAWKRDNQNHPDQDAYSKYLDQWNSWRDQLINQRRSILDAMTKAKLECKELLMAKFECLDAATKTDQDSSQVESKFNQGSNNSTGKRPFESDGCRSENPFESASAMRNDDSSRKPFAAPFTSQNSNSDEIERRPDIAPRASIPPLMPGLGSGEKGGRDRPVEKILRNTGGRPRDDRNAFDDDYQQNSREENPFSMNSGFGGRNFAGDRKEESRVRKSRFDNDADISLPFEWTLPSQSKEEKNPFETAKLASNPFSLSSGPNPFEVGQQPRLPSLNDFIQKTNLEFSSTSANPFVMASGSSSSEQLNPSSKREPQFERIPRDPGEKPKVNSNPVSIRLEANPSGFPLFVAAKEQPPPPKNEDDFSQMFSRDRGPAPVSRNEAQFDMDDDFVDDAEVIDYGAGGNSVDSMDFPRGENPDGNNEDDDPDFSLEDSEVIDYSQGVPPNEAGFPDFHGDSYGGYDEGYNQGYYDPASRGRGRGGWSRGTRGGHAMGRGGPHPQHYPSEQFGPARGRGVFRGGARGGMRGPPPPQDWFQHDERESPEIVELPDSPEGGLPGVRIAPPNPDSESRERRRSRERYNRDRSRSRSTERVSRRRYDDRRDRDRRSPDRRGRNDDRDDRRDRDRGRDRRRSRSPSNDRDRPVVRNPLFPSASAGMLGTNPASNPPAPRYQTVLIEDILNTPGRLKRPSRLVIFIRGLPGSGKSHIVKLIKEREVEMGGKAPRILSLDNYFITELEKMEKDPVSGVEVKKTVMEYEFDEEREPLYRAQLVRQFKKTLDEGYFSFVIVDCVNEFVRQFEEMATAATQKRFQVYVAEIEESVDVCARRNIHKRTRDEILKISRSWERTPANYVKLDTRTLLQDEAIQEVEMEDVSDVEADSGEKEEKSLTPAERGKIGPQVVDLEDIGSDEDSGDTDQMSSKWDKLEPSQEKLNKLDGLMKRKRTNSDDDADSAPSIENWLQSHMPEDYAYRRPEQSGQKRVRWADIEEKREQERMREVGFVVGVTDWKRMMDPTGGSSALTKTKFF